MEFFSDIKLFISGSINGCDSVCLVFIDVFPNFEMLNLIKWR